MKAYTVGLVGKMPLLLHADNIEWADEMEAWRARPENKKISRAGDDRSPAFRWLGCLCHDGRVVGLPNDYLMRCFMEGAAMVPVPGARGSKTFKAQSQSGMLVDGTHWPLQIGGKDVPVGPLLKLREEESFEVQQAAAKKAGFSLFVKRARVGQAKHVRVRPRFDEWAASGVVHVWDEQITLDVLRQIAMHAGRYKGLGDWRPGGRTPGPFGMFDVTVE